MFYRKTGFAVILFFSSLLNVNAQTLNSPVGIYGALHVKGSRILDRNENPVALHGMSLFWSQWGGKYYNEKCVRWLYNDFHCTVIRAPVGIEFGGYLTDPEKEIKRVTAVIDACIDAGIYVLVDWHDHHAESHIEQAKMFFGIIAERYRDKPNLIYELYNEPLKVSWSKVIKPYAESVIKTIREYSPDNLIVVGTPSWSQDVDEAAMDPVKDQNTAYAIHFYTGTHRQYLRDKAVAALNKGAALFVTEYGISEADGNGVADKEETERWFSFVKENNLSTCNWSVIDK
jgi:endoglucanase